MKLLIDTHLLLWAADGSKKLPKGARELIADEANELFFSPASLWEIAIKRSLGRPDFRVGVSQLRRGLLENGYLELAITGPHAVAVDTLPLIHRDPFDRMLVAQAAAENLILLTAYSTLAGYGKTVRVV